MMFEPAGRRADRCGIVNAPRRSRSGCQQCRQRKRKCDERHPRCAACVQRGLPCNWHREAQRPVTRRQQHYNKDFTVPQEMRPLVNVFAAPTASVVQRLLSHFCTAGPLWITAGGDAKGAACLGLIMPVTTRSPLVLNCVLALAAGDLSKYVPASSDMASLSYGFYGQAVAGVQSALDKELTGSESERPLTDAGDETLLAIILLCVHEAVNFTTADRILTHINAAAALCYSRSFSTAPDAGLRGLLFEIFCYVFSLTAFSHGHSLQLHLALQVFSSPFLSGSYYQGILLGRGLEVFSFILRVAMLTGSTASTPVFDDAAAAELSIIEARLVDLSLPQPHDDDSIIATTDEDIAFELYRLACLIHVRKTLHPELAPYAAEIQQLVVQFISNLNELPPSSPANGILCWPLVVAGMSSVVGTHRRLIAGRLRKNHETWRTDILSKSVDILSKKWREEKSAGRLHAQRMGVSCLTEAWTSLAATRALQYPVPLL